MCLENAYMRYIYAEIMTECCVEPAAGGIGEGAALGEGDESGRTADTARKYGDAAGTSGYVLAGRGLGRCMPGPDDP